MKNDAFKKCAFISFNCVQAQLSVVVLLSLLLRSCCNLMSSLWCSVIANICLCSGELFLLWKLTTRHATTHVRTHGSAQEPRTNDGEHKDDGNHNWARAHTKNARISSACSLRIARSKRAAHYCPATCFVRFQTVFNCKIVHRIPDIFCFGPMWPGRRQRPEEIDRVTFIIVNIRCQFTNAERAKWPMRKDAEESHGWNLRETREITRAARKHFGRCQCIERTLS